MPRPRPTKTSIPTTSERKLSDVAKHLVVPSGIKTTGYPAVEAQCRKMGVQHDPWQKGLARAILAKRANGLYAAGIGGVLISICRQVGKTFSIGTIVFALCILFPGIKVLWTAHHSATSDETFETLSALARRRRIAPYIAHNGIRQGNGKQRIKFPVRELHRPCEPGGGEQPVAVEEVRGLVALLARPFEVAAHGDDAAGGGERRRPEPGRELLHPGVDDRSALRPIRGLLPVPPHELKDPALAAVAHDRRVHRRGDRVRARPRLPPVLRLAALGDILPDQLVRLGIVRESSAHGSDHTSDAWRRRVWSGRGDARPNGASHSQESGPWVAWGQSRQAAPVKDSCSLSQISCRAGSFAVHLWKEPHEASTS